ncbi:MAG: class I SAM-dependent methyltransferase [Gammaproteobacteria bacterium]
MTFLTKKAREKADAARYAIRRFVEEIARDTPEGALVVDAGAGNCRYKPYFARQRYLAADFCKVSDKNYKRMDVVTDLAAFALKADSVDTVVSIEVLEHVPEPLQVLKEFHRVLKPGAPLYLTCPLNWGVHEAPFDFYRYTPYGLTRLFEQAGFEVRYIRPKGGYFWLLAKFFTRLPDQIPRPERGVRRVLYKISYRILREVFFYWIPYVLFHMDGLDRRKDFTLGYLCCATKAEAAG